MIFQVFFLSFIISLVGTIPPATINITVMQLSLKRKAKTAYFLALGAALIDDVYGALAVRIQIYLSEQIEFTNFFYLLAAAVLLVLGVFSIRSKTSSSDVKPIDDVKKGFAKGVVLGILNPLAMPFWLGVTTFLQVNGLVDLSGNNYWSYVLGVFLGEFLMLVIIIRIGSRFTRVADNQLIVNTIPGVAFLLLAAANFIQWAVYYF